MPKHLEPIKRTIGASVAGRILNPIKRRPELPAFAPAPDPINESANPGEPEGNAAVELDQLQAGFRERMAEENKRRAGATDGSYYFSVCFETGEQATALLKALGLQPDGLFIDGRAMADRLGIGLPAASVSYNTGSKIDPKLKALVRR